MLAALADWVPLISVLIVGIVGSGGVYALLKLRDEKNAIFVGSATNLVDASNELVVVQREELKQLREQIDALEAKLAAQGALSLRVREMERELENERIQRRQLEIQRDTLTRRVQELEGEVKRLRNEMNGRP